ncbi:hypothetical protein NL676_012932 [Syzygium grande]|nr:hypothetical protein NL676_012932 [Syzygium grande]
MASTLVLVVVFVFDLVAFALAVAAEQRRNTAKIGEDAGKIYCRYDSDIATGLGIGSLLFLLASQLLIVAVSRCLCCGKALRPSGARTWAIVLFITGWVFFIIAEACLLAGSRYWREDGESVADFGSWRWYYPQLGNPQSVDIGSRFLLSSRMFQSRVTP